MTSVQTAPVIIIGMHRSGTSMAARLLEPLGLFAGRRTERNHEAWFFLRLNDWLLAQCAARWDHPEPIDLLLENEPVRAQTGRYIEGLLHSPRVLSYLGWRRYLRHRSPANLPAPWGWKDPRNTFTLPLWLDRFANARIIHVTRHGVDVAGSLMVRKTKSFTAAADRYARCGRWYWLGEKRGGFADTLRLQTLDDAFDLWERYIRRGRAHVEALGERAITVRYEDLLAEPVPQLRRLADFCRLDADNERLAALAGRVSPDRRFAYRRNEELSAFAERVRDRLAAEGY